uniref:Uncharacterized protein n=1 Tax=Thermofilum pendens TaxID=2269 RepID=A0A7C1SM80_THEPE
MTGAVGAQEIKIEVSLAVEHETAENMLKALLADDFSGFGVLLQAAAERGELTYTLTLSCNSIYRAKSIANELLRLIRMMQEAYILLEAHTHNAWSTRKE